MNSRVPQIDPMAFAQEHWPHVYFYDRQKEIIYSVVHNDETFVVAGNKLGKDFVAGFICLYFFLTRTPCRIVTTSAKEDHLRVLWGEIGNYVQTSRRPLTRDKGGPLVLNYRSIFKYVGEEKCPLSYITGLVASPDSIAAMQGHHVAKTGDGIPRTLFVSDESSNVPDDYYRMARGWFNRSLVIGNPWPCENFFKHAIKGKPGSEDRGGDTLDPLYKPVPDDDRFPIQRYYRKVFKIRAEDSPNVRLGLAQARAGLEPTGEIIVPGVKDYAEYVKDRMTWDAIQQCVSLDAEFYEGAENLLFPSEWLASSEAYHNTLARDEGRKAKTMGVDPGGGGDKTAMCVVDEKGIIELASKKTADTSVIPKNIMEFARKHGIIPQNIFLDQGGGGQQHADYLRSKGYMVRTVAFGSPVTPPPRRGMVDLKKIAREREERYVCKNRRAQMYYDLSCLLDPGLGGGTRFGIPGIYSELRRQLSVIPRIYDGEGRLGIPPKRKKSKDDKTVTLIDLIGHSPDEADALVLAVHGLVHVTQKSKLGPAWK